MRLLWALALPLASCGEGSSAPPDGTDGAGDDGAGDDGVGDDASCVDASVAVAISCPEEIDLGCVPESGAPASFPVSASSCDDPAPSIACAPADGSLFGPGETLVRCTATVAGGDEASCGFPVRAERDGAFVLTCSGPVTAACAGSPTPVDVPEPAVEEICGGAAGGVSSDAPAGGFPTGDTLVTFTAIGGAGFEAQCGTLVIVTDDDPPALACPAPTTLVRTDAGTLPPPPVTGRDSCAGEIPAEASPPSLERGTTTVRYEVSDGAGHRAECTTDVTVLDAFAVTGLRVASARSGGDGSTSVSLAWEPSGGADASAYRVERAEAPDGPWTPLGTPGTGTLVLTDPALPGNVAYYRVVTLAGSVDGGATAPVRALAIRASSYDIRDQTVPTVPFRTTLYGVVRHPADASYGPYPLAVLLHGNHGNCRPSPFDSDDECAETQDHDCHWGGYTTTPNAEGMAYQAETLAANGYVAVTISGNALNCRDDYIPERAELIVEHLRRWAGWATTGGSPFGSTFVGVVDVSRTGLVGHSRGGEAVALVPSRLASAPVAGVDVRSVFSIAPTDYHSPRPVEADYAVLLPACDGDVSSLDGMHIYDRSLDSDDGSARSQVLFAGANHNYFSTEWVYDDNGWGLVCSTRDEVGGIAQRGMLEATLAAWFDGTLAGGRALEGFLTADDETPLGIDAWAGTDLDLRWSHAAAGRLEIDDFEGPGSPDRNLLGGPNAFDGFYTARRCRENDCDSSFDHAKNAVFLTWDSGTPVATWGLGALDASGWPALSFRMASRRSTYNARIAEQEFLVHLFDSDGTRVDLLLSGVRRVPHLYPSNMQREILQTVRVRLDDLSAVIPELDVGSLDRLELEMTVPGHAQGSVLITDVELAR